MYGVPSDLPLKAFVGGEFNQIALGRFQTQFHSSGTGTISVEGRWELRGSGGDIIDAWTEPEQREADRLHSIIDVPVIRYAIDSPWSFTNACENGHRLTVFDDTPQYEAFAIHLDGQPSMYV